VHDGIYDSRGRDGSVGSTENTENNNRFSDRPVGIAALNWNTIDPFDMRVVDAATGNTLYPNGATINRTTQLQVGALSRAFFGLPYSNTDTYTDFNDSALELDGSRIRRVHVFCYNANGTFLNHDTIDSPPYQFTPNAIHTDCSYMKIIAEDQYFGHSGKTGTMIFKLQ
jgi:hypothetical protein